ncbi:MAG: hypothetical protein RL060_259 [Bacteroidota bacterium]|jgi:hypothetical protein
MKKTFLTFLYSTIIYCAIAQENTKMKMGGGGGFTIGMGNMDISSLEAFVKKESRQFTDKQMLIGGTGHAFIENFVIGGSGTALLGDKIKTDSTIVSISGGIGTFDIGYLLCNKDKLKIYPMIGLGGTGIGVQIIKNNNYTINQIVNDPWKEINIGLGEFVLDVSLNIDLMPLLEYDAKENTYSGFLTGLKFGYAFSPSSSDWMFAGGNISDGPSFGLNMFYFKINLGGFGFQK